MHRSSRLFVVLLLVLLLLPSAVQAAEPLHAKPSALLSWDLLAGVWSSLTSTWTDNGCEADPSGRCLPRQDVAPATNNGCSADPDGRRCLAHQASTATADNGCSLDPNGRCGRAVLDEGCSLDPSGGCLGGR
jgi:hypothetical protein